jgi:hypothetical protein
MMPKGMLTTLVGMDRIRWEIIRYLQVGDSWFSEDCSKTFTCVPCEDCGESFTQVETEDCENCEHNEDGLCAPKTPGKQRRKLLYIILCNVASLHSAVCVNCLHCFRWHARMHERIFVYIL